MVSDVATEVATKSTFKFDADALGALEDGAWPVASPVPCDASI